MNSPDSLTSLINKLPTKESLKTIQFNVVDFEKDDDTNHHIEFINAASMTELWIMELKLLIKVRLNLLLVELFRPLPPPLLWLLVFSQLGTMQGCWWKNQYWKIHQWICQFSFTIFSIFWSYCFSKGQIQQHRIRQNFGIDLNCCVPWHISLIDYFENLQLVKLAMVSQGVSLIYASFWGSKKLKERLTWVFLL